MTKTRDSFNHQANPVSAFMSSGIKASFDVAGHGTVHTAQADVSAAPAPTSGPAPKN